MRLRRSLQRHPALASVALLLVAIWTIHFGRGQNPGSTAPPGQRAALPPLPAPQAIPKPGPVTDQPYAPQAILQGGIVVTLYAPGSKYLNADKVREAEKYNMNKDVPGRISSIVNIHNPSIEVHLVDRSLNTGSAVILVAGGGHNTLNVGTEAADFVPFFYNYGVNTVILRNRLRKDGYNAKTDAVNDAQQAIRMVRAYAKEWQIDPNRIGIMGFSAGAELAAPAAIAFDTFDKANNEASDPLAGISSRPDFVGIVYPGPTPFARGASPPIPRNVPPSFIVCAGSGDQVHAIDGHVGQFHGLRVNPDDGEVLSILIKRHPWGHAEVAVPIGKVSGFEAGVQLSITKQEVKDLAP